MNEIEMLAEYINREIACCQADLSILEKKKQTATNRNIADRLRVKENTFAKVLLYIKQVKAEND